MLTLFHHPMSTPSRFVRLMFAEYGEELQLIEEKPWTKRREFLQLNPAGTLPVLLTEREQPVAGAFVIAEYVDETRGIMQRGHRLLAEDPMGRAEIRRLSEWFLVKMENEVTRHIVRERIFRPMMKPEEGGGSPDSAAIRAARGNVREHMKYLNWLAASRDWVAGPKLTYGDLAAGATVSSLDYLGEIPWSEFPQAKEWYMRLKSRPSFRPLLLDRVRGLAPVSHYADLDF
jgi:glutathione S-transferase